MSVSRDRERGIVGHKAGPMSWGRSTTALEHCDRRGKGRSTTGQGREAWVSAWHRPSAVRPSSAYCPSSSSVRLTNAEAAQTASAGAELEPLGQLELAEVVGVELAGLDVEVFAGEQQAAEAVSRDSPWRRPGPAGSRTSTRS